MTDYTMPDDVRSSVADLVAYSYAEEERDYVQDGENRPHIFTDIQRIQEWLEATATEGAPR